MAKRISADVDVEMRKRIASATSAENLTKYNNATDKFVFCLDLLDLSLTVNGDEFCSFWVERLESRFELLAGLETVEEDEEVIPEDSLLFLSDARGVYIPRDFAEEVKHECVEGVSKEDWDDLSKGPEYEWYWETWDRVENNAIVTDPSTKIRYYLRHDGDLWLVPIKD